MRNDSRAGRLFMHFAAGWFLVLIVFVFVAGCSGEGGDPKLYRKYCATCHGPDGAGLRELYPALTDSRYLDQKLEQLPCLIVNGAGETVVMPGFPQLQVAEIGELVSYLSGRWGPTRATVPEDQLTVWLENCP